MVSLDPAVWIAALMTIGIYSLGFKYTRLYKFCEYTFVGLGGGYGVVLAWDNIKRIGIVGLSGGNYFLIIPMILGVLLFARYVREYQWVSRYPIALMVGIGTGIAVRGNVQADIVKQIVSTAKPLWGGDLLTNFNNLLIVVLVLAGLIFFVFSMPVHKVPGGSVISRIGRLGLMVGFGALVANTVMARYSFLIGRLQFLLFQWLGL